MEMERISIPNKKGSGQLCLLSVSKYYTSPDTRPDTKLGKPLKELPKQKRNRLLPTNFNGYFMYKKHLLEESYRIFMIVNNIKGEIYRKENSFVFLDPEISELKSDLKKGHEFKSQTLMVKSPFMSENDIEDANKGLYVDASYRTPRRVIRTINRAFENLISKKFVYEFEEIMFMTPMGNKHLDVNNQYSEVFLKALVENKIIPTPLMPWVEKGIINLSGDKEEMDKAFFQVKMHEYIAHRYLKKLRALKKK